LGWALAHAGAAFGVYGVACGLESVVLYSITVYGVIALAAPSIVEEVPKIVPDSYLAVYRKFLLEIKEISLLTLVIL
jgi:hypothetical protein